MELKLRSLREDPAFWRRAGVKLPEYDIEAAARRTRQAPLWLHFGAGNIFRGFVAALQQRLLDGGEADRGIIAAETFDVDIVDKIYDPYDNLTLNVTLNPDGTTRREVIASVAQALRADRDLARLRQIARCPSLQLISFAVTEKGYALCKPDGTLLPGVREELQEGPDGPRTAMGTVAALLLERFRAGAYPLALVSLDNCSRNGEKLRSSVLAVARGWLEKGFVQRDFLDYISDGARVAFPWSMIDKITPRPHESVERSLTEDGIEAMAPLVTDRGTYIAPFVNAERPEYLVIEDSFPNGRPPLERAGVYMTDRDTVNRTERMKVTTCLNPLHTAMSVYGCLLGYTLIREETRDRDIAALIRRLGYTEGLPVVTHPGIIDPRAFLDEVVEERLPNPFMPDAPQRIATDTSQKVGIRFGETIKSYLSQGRDLKALTAIPLALAGWLRYLLAVDDKLAPMPVSDDPLREELQAMLSGIVPGRPETYTGQLRPILSNAAVFGLDLTDTPLADRIEAYFTAELAGPGAVRRTLHETLFKEGEGLCPCK